MRILASGFLSNASTPRGRPAALAMVSRVQQSQDTLFALAGDTGGKALHDYNDLTRGIVQAQQNITSHYILG